jgi:hypothetical protein
MNNFLLALLLAIIGLIVLNPKVIDFVQTNITSKIPFLNSSTGGKVTLTFPTSIVHTLVFFILALIVLSIFNRKSKEKFWFEVSPNLPKCCKGYIGKPTSFEFSSSNDINDGFGSCGNGFPCGDLKDETKNSQFGWDGMVNVNQSADNVVGGCGYPQSGMTYYGPATF